jgi:hypothetical protein
VTATDRMLAVHDAWVANPDPQYKDIPPREFEEACEALFDAIVGEDIPAEMRDLVRAIETFQTQWQLYAGGAREHDGRPKGSLWRALRQIIKDRLQTSELRPKKPEPVHELLRQNVSPNQIAQAIYGWKGVGPFLKDGVVLYDLIDKEAKTPGSVITDPNWLPGYEVERLREHNISLKKRQDKIDELIAGPEKARPQDPLQLLKEGQFVDVIAKVTGYTEEQVLGMAKIINVEPSYRTPLTGNVRGPYDAPLRPSDAAMVDSMANKPAEPNPAVKRVPKGTGARVRELFESGMGAPEIAATVGLGLTPRDVVKLLKQSAA